MKPVGRFDVWAKRGTGKQRGWSRIGQGITADEVEDLTEDEEQVHIEEAET